ncbi:MAG: hypothetical protein ACW99U_15160 [Candidatus Thorarchaeota archaeon]|jgi:hypothetical protein
MKRREWHRFLSVVLFAMSGIIMSGIYFGWFFWLETTILYPLLALTLISFLCGVVNVVLSSRPYGVKVRGYEGIIYRVIKAPGDRNEHMIQGEPHRTFRDAVREAWPFDDCDVDGNWRILTKAGKDVTDMMLSSWEGTVEIVFRT